MNLHEKKGRTFYCNLDTNSHWARDGVNHGAYLTMNPRGLNKKYMGCLERLTVFTDVENIFDT